MAKGVDYAWGRPSMAQLKAAGVTFVCRYLSGADPSKAITKGEADTLKAAGIAIVVVFEDSGTMLRSAGAPEGHHSPVPVPNRSPHLSLSGRTGGVSNARTADAQATAAGLAGCPIFFACDFDASAAQQQLINDYLDGAASVIGLARTGIYGGFWPLSRARAAGKAVYFWGTPAWSGGNWSTAAWRPHLMQGGVVTIGGVSCDWDSSNFADFGQDQASAPAEPTIQLGASGPAVARMQTRLNVHGATPSLTVDGVFGAGTLAAVKAFQLRAGLTADGVCGPATWAALDRAPAPVPDGFPAPGGLAVGAGTASLPVSWTPVHASDGTVPASYMVSAFGLDGKMYRQVTVAGPPATLDQLHPGWTYNIRVQASATSPYATIRAKA